MIITIVSETNTSVNKPVISARGHSVVNVQSKHPSKATAYILTINAEPMTCAAMLDLLSKMVIKRLKIRVWSPEKNPARYALVWKSIIKRFCRITCKQIAAVNKWSRFFRVETGWNFNKLIKRCFEVKISLECSISELLPSLSDPVSIIWSDSKYWSDFALLISALFRGLVQENLHISNLY